MENVKQLRDDLLATYEKLRDGEIGLNEAKQLSNVAGKILSSAKVQLEYNKHTSSKAQIKFLQVEE